MYCLNNPRRLLVGERDLRSIIKNLRKSGLFGVFVKDSASRPRIQGLQKPSVPGDVLDESRVAVRRGVDVAVVPDGEHGLQGMAHHAGHGDGQQVVGLVVLKDVAALAVQQEHHGLQPNRNSRVSG